MNKIRLIVFLVLSIVLIPGICLGATYYVDANNGDDANAGTSDAPWQTFQRALPDYSGVGNVVQQGDTVYVASGDYGQVTYNEGGDTGRSDWITYIGDVNDKPVINGFTVSRTPNAYMKIYNFKYEPQNGELNSIGIVGEGKLINMVSRLEFFNCYVIGVNGDVGPKLSFGNSPSNMVAVNLRYTEHIRFDGLEINGGPCGLRLSYYNAHIDVINSYLHDQWNDGINIYPNVDGASDILLDNILITDLIVKPRTHDAAHLDYVQTSTTIDNLTIRNSIFHLTWNPEWETVGGERHYYGFMGQHSGKNYVFENNLIYGLNRGGGWRCAGAVDGLTVRNNTFAHSSTFDYNAIVGGDCTSVKNYNNIYHVRFSMIAPPGEVSQGNNIYVSYVNAGSGKTGPVMDGSSTLIDAEDVESIFVNFNNDDFGLTEDSLARDFGNPLNATLTDITGNYRDASPDAGCYEYGASSTQPEADEIVVESTVLSLYNNVIRAGGNSQAIIRCDLLEAGSLSVVIYDSRGREIIILFDGNKALGRHEFAWVGMDSSGNKVGSGIYIVNMKSGSYSETKKIAVVK